MSTINLVIIIVAVVSVIAILGVRAGASRGTRVEQRPPPSDRTDID